MAFHPGALPKVPSAAGEIDHRFRRRQVLESYRAGRVAATDICDAHPELRRAGAEVGTPVDGDCPVCGDATLRHVTYVFGPRLPAHGRCITTRRELDRIAARKGTFVAYVVEVCPPCAWNHLIRAFLLGHSS